MSVIAKLGDILYIQPCGRSITSYIDGIEMRSPYSKYNGSLNYTWINHRNIGPIDNQGCSDELRSNRAAFCY